MHSVFGIAKSTWLSTKKRNVMTFIIYVQPVFLFVLYSMANPFNSDVNSKEFWFVLTNASTLSCWSICVFSTISDIDRDRWTGMLNIIQLSPTGLAKVFVVRMLVNALQSVISFAIILLLSSAVIGYLPKSTSDLISILLLISNFFIIGLFSLLFSALMAMSPHSHLYMNFIEYPLFLISGIGFTIGLLPNAMQFSSFLFPFGFIAECIRFREGISLVENSMLSVGAIISFLGAMLTISIGIVSFKSLNKRLNEKGALL